MTKGELIKLLEPFDDGQYVYVGLHDKGRAGHWQLSIQGVKAQEPWHAGPPEMICILAHSKNSVIETKGE